MILFTRTLKGNEMKVNVWVAATLAALSLAGCATVDKGPVAGPSGPQGQGAAGAAKGAYRLVNPVDIQHVDSAAVFYLVRSGEQWSLSFDAEAFRRNGGERLAYWLDGKKVAFVFDRADPKHPSLDDTPMCDDKDRDRSKRGYTLCSSGFSHTHTSGSTVFARTLVGMATAGTSELAFASMGAHYQRISQEELQAALAPLGIDRAFWLKDYRQRATAATVSALNDFIRRYERDDPDHQIAKAREALAALSRNAGILDAAERATPKLAQYRPRFMPANPQKYCAPLKSNAEDFRYCQAEAANMVGRLADERAAAARRLDVCQAVSTAVPGGVQAAVCQPYSTGSCRAATAPGQQVCDILNRKGQS